MTELISLILIGLVVWWFCNHDAKYKRAKQRYRDGDSRDLAEYYETMPRWAANDTTRGQAKSYRAEADHEAAERKESKS